MTEPSYSDSHAPPKWVLLVVALVFGLAAWLMLRTYTSAGARECLVLYHSARTALDTARVDTTVTPGSHAQHDPRSCGFMRISARWR